MTAVIFGGSGFIGRHLARRLADQGEDVLLADLEPPAFETADGVRFERCDVRAPIELDAGEEPTVYNLAAVHRSPGHSDHEYFETNVQGARNVIDFCERSRTPLLFFTSTISVYGPSEEPLSEASELRAPSAYGQSKVAAEQVHERWANAAAGRRLVTVRAGSVFGEGEHGNFTRLAGAISRHSFAYPARRDTRKACGYVKELVETFAFAQSLASPIAVYNFGFPQVPTTQEVCEALAAVGDFSPPRVVIPMTLVMGAARILGAFGASSYDPERVVKLTESTNVVPAWLLEHGYKFRFDLRGALADWYSSARAFK